MKFFHLADLHIGKQVNGFSMLEDQRYILEEVLKYAKSERPDAVVIAGDLYDKPVPQTEAVRLLDWFLTELAARSIPVLAISGNHDSPERIGFADRIMEQQQVFIYGNFEGRCRQITLNDAYGPANFYLLPFLKPSYVKRHYPEAGIESYHDAVAAVLQAESEAMAEAGTDTQRNVLVAHQFVIAAGTKPQRSESEVGPVGGIDSVEAAVMSAFDYVALGHLHGAQQMGRETIRYAGSPLKYSASEHRHKKSLTVITMKEKGETEVEQLPLIPLRDMRLIRGPLAAITADEVTRAGNSDDYMHITLTDEEEIMDAIGRVRSVYPNVMTLTFDNQRSRAEADLEGVQLNDTRTPLELFEAFYSEQNGSEIAADEQEIMTRLLNKDGGIR